MEFKLATTRLDEDGVICPGCKLVIPPGTEAVRWVELPMILRSTMSGATYHSAECARLDVRERYHAQVESKSTNRTGWDAHASSNEERLMTLKLFYDWAEHRRGADDGLTGHT
jgi:hypothetical protein